MNFRYLVEEIAPAGSFDELNFDGDKTWPLQEAGREAGKAAIEAGPSVGFMKYLD